MGIAVRPPEADAPLIVDPDAMLAGTVALQFLQPVAGRHPQIRQRLGGINSHQLPQHGALERRGIVPDALAVEETLRITIGEAFDHRRIITLNVINVKRYYVAS